MKKLLLSLALVLCFTAAKATGFDFCLGPKIGYQTATLSLSSSLSLDKAEITKNFKDHFTAGVFGRLTIKNFIIQPELLWFRTGSVFDFNIDPTFKPSVTLTQQRLALPIFLGYQLDGKLVKVRGNVGPVMYFNLSQEQNVNNKGENVSINLGTKSMTWGAALNVGVDVWKLTLDISYSFGLTKMFGKESVDWSFNERKGTINLDDTTNMFTVTLGLKFL